MPKEKKIFEIATLYTQVHARVFCPLRILRPCLQMAKICGYAIQQLRNDR